jgi:hypothetical protein
VKLQGAETGRVRLISEPLQVFRATEKGDDVEALTAAFRWIPPRIESLCRALAEFYLRQSLQRVPTDDLILETQHLLMISWSLRTGEAKGYADQVFAFPGVMASDGVTLLPKDDLLFARIRDCDVLNRCPQGPDLWMDYETFRRSEFPTVANDKQFAELLEEAKKKPLLTLVLDHGYWKVARLARGLSEALRAQGHGNGIAG